VNTGEGGDGMAGILARLPLEGAVVHHDDVMKSYVGSWFTYFGRDPG
jgi:hypothetical protein